MSNGSDYGFSWQTPVGWLSDYVPISEVAATPQVAVAKKLAHYMSIASLTPEVTFQKLTLDQLPKDRFHHHSGAKGPHMCEFIACGMFMSGVFGFRHWKFPTGIVHYILDHDWMPPQDFLDALSELEDPPEDVQVQGWIAPNINQLFHKTSLNYRL